MGDHVTTKLPNGGTHIRYSGGTEVWLDDSGITHRDDGPAVIYSDGLIEYWIKGDIPISILDLLIIREEIDVEMFPSATLLSNISYRWWIYCAAEYRAYRLDSHDLALAILWINRG